LQTTDVRLCQYTFQVRSIVLKESSTPVRRKLRA
jgi:hypothetical protein